MAGKFYYDQKKKYYLFLLWRESFITTGKIKSCIYFVVAGKFYYDRKKKSSIYFVVAGKFYYEQKKSSIYFVVAGKFYYDREIKKVLSILLWRESFITTGKKKFYLFCCGGKVLLRPE